MIAHCRCAVTRQAPADGQPARDRTAGRNRPTRCLPPQVCRRVDTARLRPVFGFTAASFFQASHSASVGATSLQSSAGHSVSKMPQSSNGGGFDPALFAPEGLPDDSLEFCVWLPPSPGSAACRSAESRPRGRASSRALPRAAWEIVPQDYCPIWRSWSSRRSPSDIQSISKEAAGPVSAGRLARRRNCVGPLPSNCSRARAILV